MLLFSTTSTLLYFRQADLVRHAFNSEDARTTFFAATDLAVNILTLLTQVFIASRLLNRYGTALVLCFLPVLTIIGFLSLSLWPTLLAVMLFSIFRRAGNFALARPARECCLPCYNGKINTKRKVLLIRLCTGRVIRWVPGAGRRWGPSVYRWL